MSAGAKIQKLTAQPAVHAELMAISNGSEGSSLPTGGHFGTRISAWQHPLALGFNKGLRLLPEI